jgi:ParB-like chromosome segregation protein Spo0J
MLIFLPSSLVCATENQDKKVALIRNRERSDFSPLERSFRGKRHGGANLA